jgi:DNA-binding Lrp family transcriptional regulator
VIDLSASLDGKDRLLLAYLRRHARMTTVELAGKLGLSRSSVHARIARLERSGIIRGYTVVLSEESLSERLRCWFVIRVEKGATTQPLLDGLRAIRGVGAVYLLTGDVDALVEVVASTTLDIDTTRLEIASLEGVSEVRTHVVLRASWPVDAAREFSAGECVDEVS